VVGLTVAVADLLSDEEISVTTDDDLVDTPIEDVTLIPCSVLLAAAEVLVGEGIVVVLALEEISVRVVLACLDTEGEANPVSQFPPVYPVGHLQVKLWRSSTQDPPF